MGEVKFVICEIKYILFKNYKAATLLLTLEWIPNCDAMKYWHNTKVLQDDEHLKAIRIFLEA